MLFFKKKGEKELENILFELRSNLENNYKDSAHAARKILIVRCEELYAQGKISEKAREKYTRLYNEYTEKMKDYHH